MDDKFFIIVSKEGVKSSKLFKNNNFTLKANEIPIGISIHLEDSIFDGIVNAELNIKEEDLSIEDKFEIRLKRIRDDE